MEMCVGRAWINWCVVKCRGFGGERLVWGGVNVGGAVGQETEWWGRWVSQEGDLSTLV